MIRRLLFKQSNTPKLLGRWQIDDNRAEIRAAMANVDSCGDSLCGDPKMLKEELEKINQRIIQFEKQKEKENEAKKNNSTKPVLDLSNLKLF